MSMHLSDKMNRAIKSIYHQFYGHMGYRTIDGLCRQALKPFGIRTTFTFSDELESGDFTIAGQYDSERKRQPIQITLVFSRQDIGRDFSWNDTKRKRFCFELSQVSQHECIHRKQNDQREIEVIGYKVEKNSQKQQQTYLSNKDEIEAYAHDIALEINEFYSRHKRKEVLAKLSRKRFLVSYQIYKDAFSGNWKAVHDRLCKKIVKWLEKL